MVITSFKTLMVRNRSWALQRTQNDPAYFDKYRQPQTPHTLWIGCSDSRVPSEVLTGSQPGELFVHRNIANMVVEQDDNFMSVLQYAVEKLKVRQIVLCGHYDCGGVQAAVRLSEYPEEFYDSPLCRRIEHLRHSLKNELDAFGTLSGDNRDALNQLVEANVRAQFSSLINTSLLQKAWKAGAELAAFGCVYDLRTGHLKILLQKNAGEEA